MRQSNRQRSRDTVRRALGLALLLLAASLASARALECPRAQLDGAQAVIRETPSKMAEFERRLVSRDSGNAVTEIINYLRRNHPEASSAEIANFLITAYCPAISAQGYSDEMAANKVSAFAALVEDRLYHSR
ncbi:MAG: hypothetical protein WAK01_20180 [Methylocystis sp.]